MRRLQYWTGQQNTETDEIPEGEIVAIEPPVVRFIGGRALEEGTEVRVWPLGVGELSNGRPATVRSCAKLGCGQYLVEIEVRGGWEVADASWGEAAVYCY